MRRVLLPGVFYFCSINLTMSITVNSLSKIYDVQNKVNNHQVIWLFYFNSTAKLKKIKKIFFLVFSFSLCTTVFAQKSKQFFNTDSLLRSKDSLGQTAIGKPYPDFEHLGDDGVLYSNKKMLGKKYYINFWFQACQPCMDEMNSLNRLNDKLKNTNSEFISFTFDAPAVVKRVREEKKLNFKIILVSDEECRRLNFNNGFPKHIVVDEKGNVEYISSHFKSNEDTIKEITDLLLNKATMQ